MTHDPHDFSFDAMPSMGGADYHDFLFDNSDFDNELGARGSAQHGPLNPAFMDPRVFEEYEVRPDSALFSDEFVLAGNQKDNGVLGAAANGSGPDFILIPVIVAIFAAMIILPALFG